MSRAAWEQLLRERQDIAGGDWVSTAQDFNDEYTFYQRGPVLRIHVRANTLVVESAWLAERVDSRTWRMVAHQCTQSFPLSVLSDPYSMGQLVGANFGNKKLKFMTVKLPKLLWSNMQPLQ